VGGQVSAHSRVAVGGMLALDHASSEVLSFAEKILQQTFIASVPLLKPLI